MHKPIVALALFVCLCGISIAWDVNTNRPGSDYNSFVLQAENPNACAQACDNEVKCQAWAYRISDGMCWVKDAKPAPQGGWTDFASGVKGEVTPAPKPSSDLTGTWKCNDGGTYYVRQAGDQIFWYGELAPNNPTWANVFHGTLSSGEIRGVWADVPKGGVLGIGSMVLKVESNDHFYATSYSGSSFGGSDWKKMG